MLFKLRHHVPPGRLPLLSNFPGRHQDPIADETKVRKKACFKPYCGPQAGQTRTKLKQSLYVTNSWAVSLRCAALGSEHRTV